MRGAMFSSIVAGTDGSDTATQAVRQAIELARSVGARIELVSAYEPVAEALPAGLGAQQGLPPRALLGADHPYGVTG